MLEVASSSQHDRAESKELQPATCSVRSGSTIFLIQGGLAKESINEALLGMDDCRTGLAGSE